MKNVLKAFGVFSMVLIIGFSFAACDDGGDSDGDGGGGGGNGFTITDIPSKYEGKYAWCEIFSTYGSIYGCQSITDPYHKGSSDYTRTVVGIKISNGSVSLPLRSYTSYSGSGTVSFEIHNTQTFDINNFDVNSRIGSGMFYNVTFSNGGARKTWNDASSWDEDF